MRTNPKLLAAAGAALLAPAALAAQTARVEGSASASVRAEGRTRGGDEEARSEGGPAAMPHLQATVDAGLPSRPVERAIRRARQERKSEAEVTRVAAETSAPLVASRPAGRAGSGRGAPPNT